MLLFALTTPACEDDSLSMSADAEVAADAGPPADSGPAGAPDATPRDAGPAARDAGTEDAGCEDTSTQESLDVPGASTYLFEGVAPGASENGAFHLAGPGGESLSGTIPTDSSGAYAVELPLFCGEQTVTLSWSAGACTVERVVFVRRTGCEPVELQVTLTWDAAGRDFELHLVRPGGQLNDDASDCTWTSCIGTSPDWGVAGDPTDDPRKDVDNVGELGPENIYLQAPAPGTYAILVEHWSLGAPDADGQVTVFASGQSATFDIIDLPSHHVRVVATVTFPGGQVMTESRVHDCNANWSGGCRDPLP